MSGYWTPLSRAKLLDLLDESLQTRDDFRRADREGQFADPNPCRTGPCAMTRTGAKLYCVPPMEYHGEMTKFAVYGYAWDGGDVVGYMEEGEELRR